MLIVGGGVAALETMMALRDLADDRVRATLVAPEPDFVYQPMAVARAIWARGGRPVSAAADTEDFGAELVRGGVAAVDARARRVVLIPATR